MRSSGCACDFTRNPNGASCGSERCDCYESLGGSIAGLLSGLPPGSRCAHAKLLPWNACSATERSCPTSSSSRT
eukprot:6144083-Amphidinium_carterae.1